MSSFLTVLCLWLVVFNAAANDALDIEEVLEWLDSEIEEIPIDENECFVFEVYDADSDQCVVEVACINDQECEDFDLAYDDFLERLENLDFEFGNHYSEGDAEQIDNLFAIEDGQLALISGSPSTVATEMWSVFSEIIPPQLVQPYLTEFSTFDDGVGNSLGFVRQTEGNLNQWQLALDSSDYQDGENYRDFVHTLIHESAHVASLNSTQVNYDNLDNCHGYLIDEGCVKKGAQLDAFYFQFWHGSLMEAHSATEEDQERIDQFYQRYSNQFVSDYAATNPVEDYAESFVYFVFKAENALGNRVRDDKARFFYQYPSLVEIRNQIREKLSRDPRFHSSL